MVLKKKVFVISLWLKALLCFCPPFIGVVLTKEEKVVFEHIFTLADYKKKGNVRTRFSFCTVLKDLLCLLMGCSVSLPVALVFWPAKRHPVALDNASLRGVAN